MLFIADLTFYSWAAIDSADVAKRRLARVAEEGAAAPRGPSAADVEAMQDLSPEDRTAFIRSMVEGLAARLEEQPDDPDGWLRLARSYAVLGEAEAARGALDRAAPLIEGLPAGAPQRPALLQRLESLRAALP